LFGESFYGPDSCQLRMDFPGNGITEAIKRCI
jgi:hypothetical protein